MLIDEMKSIIKYAIELDIDYLETFLGYEGDNVLKITTKSQSTIELLETYLKNLDLEYKSDYEISNSNENNGSFSLYVGVENPSIFKLKRV